MASPASLRSRNRSNLLAQYKIFTFDSRSRIHTQSRRCIDWPRYTQRADHRCSAISGVVEAAVARQSATAPRRGMTAMTTGSTDSSPSSGSAASALPETTTTYSSPDVARALHKSRRWYEEVLKAGRLPGHRAGRTWFLTAGDIAAALELTRRPATSVGRRRSATAATPPDSTRSPRRRTARHHRTPPQKDQPQSPVRPQT